VDRKKVTPCLVFLTPTVRSWCGRKLVRLCSPPRWRVGTREGGSGPSDAAGEGMGVWAARP
jgi:hypothetical protein